MQVLTNKTRRDRYLIADFELTCWDAAEPPEGMHSEIISIGIVEIDTRLHEIVREGEYFIRPKFSAVSDYCTQLTGITPQFLDRKGRPLPEVVRSLRKDFGIGNKVWMAWGNDRDAIIADCRRHGGDMPFSPDYVNLSAVLGFAFGKAKRFGLRRAMTAVGLEFECPQHSALADTRNTARLWLTVSNAMRTSLQPNQLPKQEEPGNQAQSALKF